MYNTLLKFIIYLITNIYSIIPLILNNDPIYKHYPVPTMLILFLPNPSCLHTPLLPCTVIQSPLNKWTLPLLQACLMWAAALIISLNL